MMEITDNQANPFDGPGLVRRAVADTKKPALRQACLVDYYDKLSNFMRALLALESFSNIIRMDEMKDSLI